MVAVPVTIFFFLMANDSYKSYNSRFSRTPAKIFSNLLNYFLKFY